MTSNANSSGWSRSNDHHRERSLPHREYLYDESGHRIAATPSSGHRRLSFGEASFIDGKLMEHIVVGQLHIGTLENGRKLVHQFSDLRHTSLYNRPGLYGLRSVYHPTSDAHQKPPKGRNPQHSCIRSGATFAIWCRVVADWPGWSAYSILGRV